ncbi:MAG: DUF1828 domain-containing protein [Planctomycetes bacterium]|nr:DUF1828 domain-containing protein [Planctomycetota bacterium]
MKSSGDICDRFTEGIANLFECKQVGKYRRIRTPYLYPDGDNIDLFCVEQGDIVLVSDLGETARWLRMQTAAKRRSIKQKSMIEDACLTHGVEFYKGVLMARCRPGDQLSSVAFRVAQAALRVSDIWFTFRTSVGESMANEVADYLDERNLSYVRDEKLTGRSGKIWTPDFHVRSAEVSSLVYVLSTGNRSMSRSLVN